jgi:pilus assembly protein CpaE
MSNDELIRVLIVDDIAETRENIRKLLEFEADFEIVGAARNGQEGIDLARELKPDVILMDINMPDIDGITATERIREYVPHSQIVILTELYAAGDVSRGARFPDQTSRSG